MGESDKPVPKKGPQLPPEDIGNFLLPDAGGKRDPDGSLSFKHGAGGLDWEYTKKDDEVEPPSAPPPPPAGGPPEADTGLEAFLPGLEDDKEPWDYDMRPPIEPTEDSPGMDGLVNWIQEHLLESAAVVGGLIVASVVGINVLGQSSSGTAGVVPAAPPIVAPAVAAPQSTSAPAASVSGNYACTGEAVPIFDNWNGDIAGNGGAAASFDTNGKLYCLAAIATYHWNSSSGKAPGTIGVTTSAGAWGPWQAAGSAGQGGAQNVNWTAFPANGQTVILDGKFSCNDSDPGTWSANRASGGQGFCRVWVKLAAKQ